MPNCDYCGKENDGELGFCAGCGGALDGPKISVVFPWVSFFAWTGLVIGISGTICAGLLSFPFFSLNKDIFSGALMWFVQLFIIGFWTLMLGLPFSIIGVLRRRRLVGWLGVLFTIGPVPLGFAMLRIAMALNGFRVVA
jgi:hypothetical protein